MCIWETTRVCSHIFPFNSKNDQGSIWFHSDSLSLIEFSSFKWPLDVFFVSRWHMVASQCHVWANFYHNIGVPWCNCLRCNEIIIFAILWWKNNWPKSKFLWILRSILCQTHGSLGRDVPSMFQPMRWPNSICKQLSTCPYLAVHGYKLTWA